MPKYRSSKLAQKKKKQLKIKIFLVVVILISFIFGLSALSKCDFLSISDVEIKGNDVVEEDDLRGIVNKNLEGEYFWIFSKKNILIYPKEFIGLEIQKVFPRIKEVDLNLDLPNLLKLSVLERNPYVLWCNSIATTTGCYFADEDGYIFEEDINISNNSLFKYYIDLNELKFGDDFVSGDIENPIRRLIFDIKDFKEVDSFVEFIDGLGLEPYKLVENNETYEIYFGDKGSKIIFDKIQSTKTIMANLQSVLNMDEFADIEEVKKLEYLDLRFGNKVFYK